MNKTGKLAIAFLLLVGGVLALVTAAARSGREPRVAIKPLSTATVAQPAAQDWLTEFTLTQQGGQEFGSADLAGTPHVVNFFFASCPSYCRMQSTEVQQLAAEFGPQGVVFLSITCDPDNDTPATLQQYASMFNANTEYWKFLTGDMLLLRRIGAEMYELPVDTQTHSEHLVAIDKWGQVRGRFRWQKHPEELAELKALLPQLLAETAPPAPAAPPAVMIDEETGLPVRQEAAGGGESPQTAAAAGDPTEEVSATADSSADGDIESSDTEDGDTAVVDPEQARAGELESPARQP